MAKAQGVLLAFVAVLGVCAIHGAGGAIFEIKNNCPFTVWAAGLPGGGKRLDRGQSWRLQVATGTSRFWGRTGCSFNGNGSGSCNSGDCGGLINCQGSGKPPATMAEFSLSQNNLNFYDISLVHGFNLPVSIIPSNSSCHAIACSSNISDIFLANLRVSDRCGGTCTSFNTSKYWNNCSTTNYSRIFKRQCQQAYTYPADDATGTFSCSGSNDFMILFCGGNPTFLQSQLSSQGENIVTRNEAAYITANVPESPPTSPMVVVNAPESPPTSPRVVNGTVSPTSTNGTAVIHGVSPAVPPGSTNLPHPLTPLSAGTSKKKVCHTL